MSIPMTADFTRSQFICIYTVLCEDLDFFEVSCVHSVLIRVNMIQIIAYLLKSLKWAKRRWV